MAEVRVGKVRVGTRSSSLMAGSQPDGLFDKGQVDPIDDNDNIRQEQAAYYIYIV